MKLPHKNLIHYTVVKIMFLQADHQLYEDL